MPIDLTELGGLAPPLRRVWWGYAGLEHRVRALCGTCIFHVDGQCTCRRRLFFGVESAVEAHRRGCVYHTVARGHKRLRTRYNRSEEL